MRIISGKFRSKRIIAPGNLPVRPTTDMAKEALFNILNNYIYFEDVHVLDLYSGTGNISYEFVSRDSPRVVSVDENQKCVRFIKSTIQDLEIDDQMHAVRSSAVDYINKTNLKFDIIFADPPYESEEYEKLYESIFNKDILNPKGIVIIEHSNETDFSDKPYFKELRKYSRVNFSIFRKEE